MLSIKGETHYDFLETSYALPYIDYKARILFSSICKGGTPPPGPWEVGLITAFPKFEVRNLAEPKATTGYQRQLANFVSPHKVVWRNVEPISFRFSIDAIPEVVGVALFKNADCLGYARLENEAAQVSVEGFGFTVKFGANAIEVGDTKRS